MLRFYLFMLWKLLVAQLLVMNQNFKPILQQIVFPNE